MNKRPKHISIVGWFLAVYFIYTLGFFFTGTFLWIVLERKIPAIQAWGAERFYQQVGYVHFLLVVLGFLCAYGLLKGHLWGKRLYYWVGLFYMTVHLWSLRIIFDIPFGRWAIFPLVDTVVVIAFFIYGHIALNRGGAHEYFARPEKITFQKFSSLARGQKWLAVLVAVLFFFTAVPVIPAAGIYLSYQVAKKIATDSYREAQKIINAPAPAPLHTLKFEKPFEVALARPDQNHRVVAKISLGYSSGNPYLDAELKQRTSQVAHIIEVVLKSKSKTDFATPMGKLNVFEELKSQVNMILSTGKIEEVYAEELEIR